jgi:hypothetical protein
MDEVFRDFSIFNVAPILNNRFSILRELARTLFQREYLTEELINEIAEKHFD